MSVLGQGVRVQYLLPFGEDGGTTGEIAMVLLLPGLVLATKHLHLWALICQKEGSQYLLSTF